MNSPATAPRRRSRNTQQVILNERREALTGTVVDCESQPLVDGYVQTYDFGFYNRIPVVNGTFSFTGITCAIRDVNFVVVDNSTHQQNEPVNDLAGNRSKRPGTAFRLWHKHRRIDHLYL